MNSDGDGLLNAIDSQLDRGCIMFVQLDVLETIRVNGHVQLRAKNGRGVTNDECTTTFRHRRVRCRGFFRGLQNDGRAIIVEDDICKMHNGAVRATIVWVGDKIGEKNMRVNVDWDVFFDIVFCRTRVGALTCNNVLGLDL